MAIIQLEAGLAPSSSPAARLYLLSSIGSLTDRYFTLLDLLDQLPYLGRCCIVFSCKSFEIVVFCLAAFCPVALSGFYAHGAVPGLHCLDAADKFISAAYIVAHAGGCSLSAYREPCSLPRQ